MAGRDPRAQDRDGSDSEERELDHSKRLRARWVAEVEKLEAVAGEIAGNPVRPVHRYDTIPAEGRVDQDMRGRSSEVADCELKRIQRARDDDWRHAAPSWAEP
jgi:hypothetical protein